MSEQSLLGKIKPDCYECIHRGTVPGSAHSCCKHPEVNVNDNPFGAMVGLFSGKANEAIYKLEIKGNPHGIRRGWFMWPANFDPAWLENCNGFKQK